MGTHILRGLLQDQATQKEAQLISAGDCQRLAGVSIGGWVIVSLLCGAALGVAATLLFQCLRRRRDARYMREADAADAAERSLPGPGKAHRTSSPQLRQKLPVSRSSRSAALGLGPLTASVHAAPSKSGLPAATARAARESAAGGVGSRQQDGVGAGDTRVADQQASQQMELRGSSHATGERHSDAIRQFVSTSYVGQAGSLVSSHSGMAGPLPAIAPSPELPRAPAQQPVAPSEQPQQPQQPQHAAVAAGLAGSVADTPAQVALVQHDVDDSYELEELDADWKALLSDVDSRLGTAGAPPMDARERAVAIKKLLVATATRGVDFAMGATIEEVLRFRNFHAGKRD